MGRVDHARIGQAAIRLSSDFEVRFPCLEAIKRLQTGVSARYSQTPSAGETINASHTEILTVPVDDSARNAFENFVGNVLIDLDCAPFKTHNPTYTSRRKDRLFLGGTIPESA